MSGHSRIRRKIPVILGIGFLCLPSVLCAQTVAERAREEKLARVKVFSERLEKRALEVREIGQERARAVETRMRDVQEARLRAQEQYQRARQEVRRAQQVMVQVKSRIRLGVSLDGTQGAEYDRLGARLEGTLDDSPAEKAGLREGDVITHLNGRSLLDPIPQEAEADFDDEGSLPVQRLMALAQKMEAGEDVEIEYLRDGSPQTVRFQTAELEDLQVHLKDLQLEVQNLGDLRENLLIRRLPGQEVNSWAFRGGEGSPQLYALGESSAGFGLKLTEMNPGLAEYFTSDEGLLVLEVPENSPLGLAPGDVILDIDGREVASQRDVRRILGSYEKDEAVSFTVVRKGRETLVEGTIG